MCEVNMDTFKSLVEVLIDKKNTTDKGIIYITSEKEERYISYKNLFDSSLKYLFMLQSQGIKYRDELIFQVPDNEEYIYLYWACILGGIIPVPLSLGNNDEHKLKVFKVWSILNKPHLITTEKVMNKMALFAGDNNLDEVFLEIQNSAILLDDVDLKNCYGDIYHPQPDDIAFIQFSSGSTGDPKGVVLTHRNLITNITAIICCSQIDKRDSTLSWLPLTHDMGLIGFHLVPLMAGIKQYIMPISLFIRRPTLWLKKASDYKATLLSSPNFGYKYLLRNLKPNYGLDWDLSSVRLIFNGAEPISAELINEFLDEMVKYGLKRESMFTVYGMAEACLAVSFPPLNERMTMLKVNRDYLSIGQHIKEVKNYEYDNYVTFADEGYPMRDCYVRVCDDSNNVLPEYVIGHIHIRGKNITSGYYNNPKATLEAITGDGWLKTGDLGFIRNGRLIVTGRYKDVIFINGQNYYANDIERIVEEIENYEFENIAAGGVHNVQTQLDEIILFVLYKKSLEEFSRLIIKVKKHVMDKIGLNVRYIIPVKKIPKTTSGKIQRYKLIDLYKTGEYDDVIEKLDILMDKLREVTVVSVENQIEINLLEICSDVLGTKDIGITDNFIESGISSLQLAQIVERINRLYPDKVTTTDFFNYTSIARLAEYIGNKDSIEISSMCLPQDYFISQPDNNDYSNSFKFYLSASQIDKLKTIAGCEGILMDDIYLSIFVCTLYQITSNKNILVNTLTRDINLVSALNIKIDEGEDLISLIRKVNSSQHVCDEKKVYQIERVLAQVKELSENTVTPLFYNKIFLNTNIELKNIYNIILKVVETNRMTYIVLEYNSTKLNKEKMKTFLNNYYKILQILLKEYNFDKEGAVI